MVLMTRKVIVDRCAYHVWDGDRMGATEAEDGAPRHLCQHHYESWRDGERDGPSRVSALDPCRRRCEDCVSSTKDA